ncbi:MAG TPA: orotate phosphoribosyltransferase [Thermoanaerobaculia bacterium]
MSFDSPVDLPALLRETGALLSGHFRLSSGLHSPNYVQCALLLEQPRNANAIGEALSEKIRPLGARKIVAPALGGVIIGYTVAQALGLPFIFTERKEGAMTLRRGFRLGESEPVVIVEDVVTTGKSTRETADVVEKHGGRVAGFASVLNRSGKANPFDAPYESLMSLALETYDERECPLCKAGTPLDSPGSRHV